jgi:putative transposase
MGGKRITGRKRHILVDTCGNLLHVTAHAANISESAGAKQLFAVCRTEFPRLEHVWADGGYGEPAGPFATFMRERFGIDLEIVRRPADHVGFEVLPRRWVVERTLAWLCRNRRLSKDYEHHERCSEAHVYVASIGTLLKRATNAP